MNKPKFHWKQLYNLRWRNLPAASGDLFLAYLFYTATRGEYLFDMSLHHFGLMAQVETLAIFSFPFLVPIAIAESETRQEKIIQPVLFIGLLSIYFLGAWSAGKWLGVSMFIGVSVITYLGLLLNLQSESIVGQLALRWACCVVVFVAASAIADMPQTINTWNRCRGSLEFGRIYFFVLGLIELTGFYQAPFFQKKKRG